MLLESLPSLSSLGRVDKDWLKDFNDDKDAEENLEDIEDNIVYV